jgi:putative transposase
MASQRRKFTEDEKLNVLRQAGQQGISNILRHYNISYSVFARWKQQFLDKGINPLGVKTEYVQLAEENARLKKIIADMALSLELKDEELRRVSSLAERKN